MAAEHEAAATIAAWAKCWRAKIHSAGRGEQPVELLFVTKAQGQLIFEDLGGWADRNRSMRHIIMAADALAGEAPLPDFATVAVQTGDRCIVRRRQLGLELHLWQSQPLSDGQRERLPLDRVLSMCSAPSYADLAVPDWACDSWVEAGISEDYDAVCARLASAGLGRAPDRRVCWFGTVHHHPVRMRLLELAKEHPNLIVCNNVHWTQAELAAGRRNEGARTPTAGAPAGALPTVTSTAAKFVPMEEQIQTFAYTLDLQGKGYSSRVKFLLHSGRPLFMAQRPWAEHYYAQMKPWEHFVPVAADLSNLPARVRWANDHQEDVARIGANGQALARQLLTRDALLRKWRDVLQRFSVERGGAHRS